MNHHSLFLRYLAALAAGLFLWVPQSPAPPAEFNYDESQVPDYELPDPLVRKDGSRVESAKDWPARRAEIVKLFEDHVYGRVPDAAEKASVKFQTAKEFPDFLGGKATMKEIQIIIAGPAEGITLNLLLIVPNAAEKPVPAFLGLNFRGNHTIHSDLRITLSESWMRPDKEGRVVDNRSTEKSRGTSSSRWAVEKIIDRGYALATMYYGDIDPDFDDGFENGVHRIFGKPASAEEWGSIATWAWGLSRALDYLEKDADVDGSRVAVLGHSRLGKTSLWAGASDPRFGLVISNNSGCGGAALSRRAFGETVKRINTSFPHWFNDAFQKYNENEAALPVDQHLLIALMAPRPVYVASAVEDEWADPNGEFLSAKHAGPVYALFGKKGVGVGKQPGIDQPVGDVVRYHVRTGKHDVTDYDWEQYLDHADHHLK